MLSLVHLSVCNNVVAYRYFFAKHFLDSIFLEIVGRHTLSCLVQLTMNAYSYGWSLYEPYPKPALGTRTRARVNVNVA